jgi:DNA-binding transcriptional ArsR family regulator
LKTGSNSIHDHRVRFESGPPRLDPVCRLKADFFRCLGHPVRIRLLAALGDDERSGGELQALVAVESSGASQHLAALRRQGLVVSSREGTSVYYRVRDPRTAEMLALAGPLSTSAPSGDTKPSIPVTVPPEDRVA